MSLLARINNRPLQDQANDGTRYNLVSSVGTVTDSVIRAIPLNRSLCISSICLTSSSSTPTLVSLGWKNGSNPSVPFFSAYVSSTSPIVKPVTLGDWYQGAQNYSLVITTSGVGPVVYSIDARLLGEGTIVEYIEHDGAPLHSAPWLLTTSAYERGLW